MSGQDHTRSYMAPHLVVSNGEKAIEFYVKALDAKLISKQTAPNSSKIMHAALEICGSPFFLCDDFPEYAGGKSRTPEALGASPVTLHLQVTDARAVWDKAVNKGAIATMPVQDMFWGDAYGKFVDPFGHDWSVAHKVKTLSDEEIEKGAAAVFARA